MPFPDEVRRFVEFAPMAIRQDIRLNVIARMHRLHPELLSKVVREETSSVGEFEGAVLRIPGGLWYVTVPRVRLAAESVRGRIPESLPAAPGRDACVVRTPSGLTIAPKLLAADKISRERVRGDARN